MASEPTLTDEQPDPRRVTGPADSGTITTKKAMLRRVNTRLSRYETDLRARDALICDLVSMGVSQAEVARWCGLERMRVSQIVRKG